MRILRTTALLLAVFILAGCATAGEDLESAGISISQTEAFSRGNWHYVPLNIYGTLDQNMVDLMTLAEKFELTHPELEVVDFEFVYQQRAHSSSPKVWGIAFYAPPK